MSERTGIIYGLVDPRNGIIRYVGLTAHSESTRLLSHIKLAKAGHVSYRSSWIRQLLRLGERPFAVILERVSEEDLSSAEIRWIASMRSVNGLLMTNITAGGDRPVFPPETRARCSAWQIGRKLSASHREHLRWIWLGRKHSDSAREKIAEWHRGRATSDETKAKISAARMGQTPSEECRAKLSAANRGREKSPETRARLSAALKGRPKSDEHRARLSASLKGQRTCLGYKHTAEARAHMSAARRGTKATLEARAHMRDGQLRRAAKERARRLAAQGQLSLMGESPDHGASRSEHSSG